MEEEYDTDAFVIFVIALISIYIFFASIFLYRRFKRYRNKEPVVRFLLFLIYVLEIRHERSARKQELVEVDEEQVENPLTAAFWINLVLVIIGIIVVSRLTVLAQKEEPELFDPYTTLGIPVGATDRMIKSAYRKMAKMHSLFLPINA